MLSLLPRMTLTTGVAISKSLGIKKMVRGGWSPTTDTSSRDTQRYGGQRRDALMRRRRGGEWRRWDGGGELGSCGYPVADYKITYFVAILSYDNYYVNLRNYSNFITKWFTVTLW